MTVPLHTWSTDHYAVPVPAGHPFPARKFSAVREMLQDTGVLATGELHRAEPAPAAWIELTHDPTYVARVFAGDLDDGEQRRLGVPWSPELVLRARAAVGATVHASRAALAHGVAGVLAGGAHHAHRDRGEGYCVFNDLAIAIHVLRAEGALRRAFIVDLDVHQGNGTAAIFADDAETFTFSMHSRTNFPRVKEHSSLDVALADGCGDAEYLTTLDAHLPAALDRFAPDLILYQAGVDPLACDRFGTLALSHDGLAARDARVFAWARARRVPVAITLGGGYGRPLEESIVAHANVWRAARRAYSGEEAVR